MMVPCIIIALGSHISVAPLMELILIPPFVVAKQGRCRALKTRSEASERQSDCTVLVVKSVTNLRYYSTTFH